MHSTGFTTAVASLLSGGTTVLLPTKSFDAEVCLRAIDGHKVQTVAIVGDAFSVHILEHLAEHGFRHANGKVNYRLVRTLMRVE